MLSVAHDLTDAQWAALTHAWGGCAYCGASATPLQRDCVQAISRGGRYPLGAGGLGEGRVARLDHHAGAHALLGTQRQQVGIQAGRARAAHQDHGLALQVGNLDGQRLAVPLALCQWVVDGQGHHGGLVLQGFEH